MNVNRDKAILLVIKKLEAKIKEYARDYADLEYKHSELKRVYLDLVEGHSSIVVGKNNTIKKLRSQLRDLNND